MSGVFVGVGDWACSTDGVADSDGAIWYLDDIVGWFDTPGVVAGPLPRPAADGVWDGHPTFGARLVTVQGTVIADSPAGSRAATDRCSTVLATATRYDMLMVDEEDRGLSRQAIVRLADATLTRPFGASSATFQLSLFAPDPRRYSSVLHSVTVGRFMPGGGFTFPASFPISFGTSGTTGIASVANAGATATWPVLRFAGPSVNPAATLVGGGTVAAAITLLAGQELVVDCGLRSVLLGTASRRQFLTADDFFALPPGQSQVYYSADDGTGDLTVEWRDAW